MDRSTSSFLIKGPSFLAGFPDMAEVESFRRELFDADVLSLFDLWISRCSAVDIPTQDQIDPTELSALLPKIYIEEWDSAAKQSRIRLAGEFHRQISGISVQGLTVDDYVTGTTNELWKKCDQYNFFELRPTFSSYSLEHVNREFQRIADLTLPVRDKTKNVRTVGIISAL